MITWRLPTQRKHIALTATTILVLGGLIILWVGGRVNAARAGSPPPDQPQFDGTLVSESLPIVQHTAGMTALRASGAGGWEVVFEEDWENGWDANKWTTIDRNGAQGGEYKWGLRDVPNPLAGGDTSAWGIGGGKDGEKLNVNNAGYRANVDSWLIMGPLDLTQIHDAELSFNYRFQADAGDTFSVLVSTDGANWQGKQLDDGGNGDWFGRNYTLDTYAGSPMVFVAFRFATDNTGNQNKKGAFVDDIVVRAALGGVQYLPHIQVQPSPTPTLTPTPPPTPTATPPSGNYFDDFTDNIDGWSARRANNSAIYSYGHRGDVDGGLRGQLEITLSSQDSYVILSPLVAAKAPPYNIEFMAKLKDTKDRHMYGLAFAGDWNGQACAAPSSPNCFTRYYELRVQYRELDGKKFQEVKLKRIDGHDASGEPVGPTLIDWLKGGNVNPDDWVEIDVYVTADGKIRLSWNGKYIAQAQDATLINQRYFGLMLLTRDNGNARVKYDYIKID